MDIKEKELHEHIQSIQTRQVLIEKAPFYVEILNSLESQFWWYHSYAGRKFFVRQATSEDTSKDLKDFAYAHDITHTEIYIVCSYVEKPSTTWSITWNTTWKSIGQPILKKDAKRV